MEEDQYAQEPNSLMLTCEQLCSTPAIEALVPNNEEWEACDVMQDRYNLMKKCVLRAFADVNSWALDNHKIESEELSYHCDVCSTPGYGDAVCSNLCDRKKEDQKKMCMYGNYIITARREISNFAKRLGSMQDDRDRCLNWVEELQTQNIQLVDQIVDLKRQLDNSLKQ